MDGRFSALANSYDTDEEIARCSPGDILLRAVMRDLVERGFAYFDLGVGEARYKEAVCDETIALYDLVMPVTTRGALAAPLLRIFLDCKRRVKQTPWLSRLSERARRSGLFRRF
jgi:CelD/BcsL family acetyltransferase involved in cellulose biosynthesis